MGRAGHYVPSLSSISLFRYRLPRQLFTGRRPTHIDWRTARKPAFVASVGAAFLSAAGNLLLGIFLPQFSVVLGYTAAISAILLAISNRASSASQTLVGFAGDKFGRQNTLLLMIVLGMISTLAFWLGSIAVVGGNRQGVMVDVHSDVWYIWRRI
jgi:MFS family permease